MKKNPIIFSLILLLSVGFANAQTKLDMTGYGRAVVSDNKLTGNQVNNDTTTRQNQVSGYFLFDLGTNLTVGNDFKANAILRVKNPFGDFYGYGVQFQFRQFQLSGKIAKLVNYELGDINVEMTPYTVFNSNEMFHTYESEVFKQRRTIQEYENFNFGNAWRLQGGQANSTININNDYLNAVGVKAFGVRTHATNAVDSADRVLAGARVELINKKFVTVGGNYTGLLDIPISTVTNYLVNHVYTGDVKFKYDTDLIGLKLDLEGGQSVKKFANKKGVNETKVNDYFYDVTGRVGVKPAHIEVYAGYKNVGAQFSSPSAQTSRLNVVSPSQLFPTFNTNNTAATTQRNLILYDRFTQENIYNRSIDFRFYQFRPQYGNLDPYGAATPNRQGFTVGLASDTSIKFLTADVSYKGFSEIVGEGVDEKRKFTQIKGGVTFNLSQVLSAKRLYTLTAGGRYENTTRGGGASVDFKSTLLDLGASAEIFKKFDVLVGYKSLAYKGKEYRTLRDNTNQVTGLESYNSVDANEGIFSGGIRLRFAEKSAFTLNYYQSVLKYKGTSDNPLADQSNYNIGQWFFNYTIQL